MARFSRVLSLLVVSLSCVLVSLVVFGDRARAQMLDSPMRPPASCHLPGCLEGTYAFVRGDYVRAADRLEEMLADDKRETLPADEAADMLLLAAVAREHADQPLEAAGAYMRAAALIDPLRGYLDYRALRALLQADAPPPKLVDRLVDQRGAPARDYPGVDLTRLRLRLHVQKKTPSATLARSALKGDREARTEACRLLADWFDSEVAADAPDDRLDTLQGLVYGTCIDIESSARKAVDAALEDYRPTPNDRLQRAEALYGAVRYEKALTELRELEIDALEQPLRCRVRFRLGRTLFRLDRYPASMEAYREVVDHCDSEATADERVRSLYAIGDYKYRKDELDTVQTVFETLLEDYPDRSHADDALLFLTRVHRKRDHRQKQFELLERALKRYPDGDMVHEIVWEVLEPIYRDGRYEAFLEKLEALPLPERDDQYFSQGRIGYLRGAASLALERRDDAEQSWTDVWRRYPFSFYGYLSHLKLRAHGFDVPTFRGESTDTPPDWFYRTEWSGRGVRRLLELGLPTLAADLERGRLAERSESSIGAVDRWRLAALEHEAGRFERSHDIPRRRIAGRPWVEPPLARRYRWRIAFPDPYGETIRSTIEAEAAQSEAEPIPALLVSALVREESGLDADVQSWAGAVGLMQLMPSTARHHDDDIEGEATPTKLERAEVNLRVGIDHLFYLAETFDGHPILMLAAYNAGAGNVRGWLRRSDASDVALWVEDISIRQTRYYVKRIVGSYAAYQWLAGSNRLDEAAGREVP